MNFEGVPDRDCAPVDGASYVTTDDGEVHTIASGGYWDIEGVYHKGPHEKRVHERDVTSSPVTLVERIVYTCSGEKFRGKRTINNARRVGDVLAGEITADGRVFHVEHTGKHWQAVDEGKLIVEVKEKV